MGMQILMDYSEENEGTNCLGIIKGKVKKFESEENKKIKIPHMGWNKVLMKNDHPIWHKIDNDAYFILCIAILLIPRMNLLSLVKQNVGIRFLL